MKISMLKSKIHRATVTQANLNYVGSITIDKKLLDVSGINEYEKVSVVNINNGQRFDTYTISGPENSGIICLNGAAARCVQENDKIIIMSFCQLDTDEVGGHTPKVVFVNDKNGIYQVSECEKHGTLSD